MTAEVDFAVHPTMPRGRRFIPAPPTCRQGQGEGHQYLHLLYLVSETNGFSGSSEKLDYVIESNLDRRGL